MAPFFYFLSLASESGPLGRVLTALALTLKAPGKSTEAHSHCAQAHTHTWIQTGGKYQLDRSPFLVSLSSTYIQIPKKGEKKHLLGYDSQVSEVYGLNE